MADKHWKRAERMIAKDCGGQRIPVTGERAGADVEHSLFAFQLKVRRSLPGWLFDWLGGIVANAAPKGKVGVLILNRPRQPRRNALVVVRWQDWVSLHGSPAVEESEAVDAVDPDAANRAERTTRDAVSDDAASNLGEPREAPER